MSKECQSNIKSTDYQDWFQTAKQKLVTFLDLVVSDLELRLKEGFKKRIVESSTKVGGWGQQWTDFPFFL